MDLLGNQQFIRRVMNRIATEWLYKSTNTATNEWKIDTGLKMSQVTSG